MSSGFLTQDSLNIDIDNVVCDLIIKCFFLCFNLNVLSQKLKKYSSIHMKSFCFSCTDACELKLESFYNNQTR